MEGILTMADNRLYLKCRVCGGTFFLGKRFGFGYYRNTEIKSDELLDFFDKHDECALSQEINFTDDIFDVEYEVAPGWLRERNELVAYYETKLKETNKRIEQLEWIVDTYERVQQEFFIDKARKETDHAEN